MKKDLTDADIKSIENENKINDVYGNESGYNRYFGSVSLFYRFLEFTFLGLLILFTLLTVIKNSDSVSYSKVEYIFRNFALKLDENNEIRTEIQYNPDSTMNFGLYGNGLAVCGNSGVTVFSATGRRTLNFGLNMKNPVLRTSAKYVLVFENGGTEFRLFNNFSQVYEGTSDFKILNAEIADNGYFALITQSDSFTSAVKVFNADFKPVSEYSMQTYVTAVGFNAEGNELAISSVGVGTDGEYSAELSYVKIGGDTFENKITVDGELPLSCGLRENGIYVLTDSSFRVFGFDGSLKTWIPHDGSLESFDVSDGGVCLLIKTASSSISKTESVKVYDFSGAMLSSYTPESVVTSLRMSGAVAYILEKGKLVKTGSGFINEVKLISTLAPVDILAYSDKKAYVCCNSAAYITFTE